MNSVRSEQKSCELPPRTVLANIAGFAIAVATAPCHTQIHSEGAAMKRIAFLLVAAAALVGVIACVVPAAGNADDNSPVYLTKIPNGYREWKLISVAHEEGNLHSFAAILGNDAAFKAARDGKLPYPDGSIIAALHYSHSPSDENNRVFGREQSFVPGAPTNIQFMVKDSKKYAATGGWGFGHFGTDGKPGDDALLKTCFPCHAKASRDLVFTRFAP
jgi:Cytochrome P460